MLKNFLDKILRVGTGVEGSFRSDHYQRHNSRRLEHLASLGLNLNGSTVLEVGAGIGDHTGFFLERGCRILSTDARQDLLDILQSRYPGVKTRRLDLENPDSAFDETFDVVYCYGVLYHLQNPSRAIEFMSQCCLKMLLLETCVSSGDEDAIHPCREDSAIPTQSVSGKGCRPTRRYVFNQLKRHFSNVYLPITQPNHEEFPIDWVSLPTGGRLTRAVFIASRTALNTPLLTWKIPMHQVRGGGET